MAYVDGFEHDVFLSYARVDDQATTGEQGWVSAFENLLQIELDRRAGRIGAVKIWRDLRGIDGNQLFDRTIPEALDTAAALVALTSNGYLASAYCMQELAHFHQRASGDDFGLAVGDRLRLVNVLLTNLHFDDWPNEVGGASGFVLHDAESAEQTGLPSEPDSSRFKKQLRDLADAVYELLKAMNDLTRPASTPAETGKGTVYLADVADSLRTQIRTLGDDLQRQGIKVVTGVPPPYKAVDHDQRVIERLRDADLSVHLFDAFAGREIEGQKGPTYPRRQLELAGTHAQSRVIWLPRHVEPAKVEDAKHQDFLQAMERGKAGGQAYDFVHGVRADLARQIAEKVGLLRAMPGSEAQQQDRSCLLVTHTKDTVHMLPVAGTLMGQGIEPFINQEANEPKLVLELFKDRLRQVASLIVFYGAVRREWVRERLDLAVQLGVAEQLDLKLAVFAAPPEKPPDEVRFSRGFLQIETLANAEEALAFAGGRA